MPEQIEKAEFPLTDGKIQGEPGFKGKIESFDGCVRPVISIR